MKEEKVEEILVFTSITFALIAASVMMFMIKTPSITANAVLENTNTQSVVMVLLMLAGLMVVIGAIVGVHQLTKETNAHKKAILDESPLQNYIKAAKENGFSDKQILEKLKSDWKSSEIKKFL